DYARAGYLVLPHDERQRARLVNWQTLLPVFMLAAVSVVPALTNKSGVAYNIGALLLCAGFLYYVTRFAIQKSNASARQLLSASIIYLPLLFVLMILLRG